MKKWSKPELIVLVRSTPEEAVLGTCKRSTTGSTNPNTEVTGCMETVIGCASKCEDIRAS